MTNLNIPTEDLDPVAELILKVGFNIDRIVVIKAYPSASRGLTLWLKDQYREHKAPITISPDNVTDLIDEYKRDFNWLLNTTNDTEKNYMISVVKNYVLFAATELSESKLQYA